MLKEFYSLLVIVGGIWLLCTSSAFAGELPSSGIVFNTIEASSLVYFCKKSQDNSLDCEFTQTKVRKKAKAEDLKSYLDKYLKIFRSWDKKDRSPSGDDISLVKDFYEELQGRKKAPNKEMQDYIKNLSELEKKDLLKSADAVLALYNNLTEENFLNTKRVDHDKETRTCIASSNPYKQSFRLVLDDVSGARSWVANGEPAGPCGIVQLSRFELDKLDWNYIAKRVVTNRQKVFLCQESHAGT